MPLRTKLVVSTIPEMETNNLILDVVKNSRNRPIAILTARQISDAFELYNKGADYVILPHFLGGEYTSRLIEKAGNNKIFYKKEREREIKILKERLKEGHEHPKVERK